MASDDRQRANISVDGVTVPLQDWRLVLERGHGARVASPLDSPNRTYADYETSWIKLVDAWKTRFNRGRPPTLTQLLSLSYSFLSAFGFPLEQVESLAEEDNGAYNEVRARRFVDAALRQAEEAQAREAATGEAVPPDEDAQAVRDLLRVFAESYERTGSHDQAQADAEAASEQCEDRGAAT